MRYGKSNKKVVISYPAEYQGTKKIVNIMKIVGMLKPENGENGLNAQVQPFVATLQFEGIISQDDLYDLLQNITREYGETDLNRLAEIMESEYDREVNITISDYNKPWKEALDKLRADAKKYSVAGLDIKAGCCIGDEELEADDEYSADERIFYLSVNNGKYTIDHLTINDVQDILYLVHTVTAEVLGYIRKTASDPEFKGQLVDIIEDFLDGSGVTSLPSSEQEKKDAGDDDSSNSALIYGSNYEKIADGLSSTIINWLGKPLPTPTTPDDGNGSNEEKNDLSEQYVISLKLNSYVQSLKDGTNGHYPSISSRDRLAELTLPEAYRSYIGICDNTLGLTSGNMYCTIEEFNPDVTADSDEEYWDERGRSKFDPDTAGSLETEAIAFGTEGWEDRLRKYMEDVLFTFISEDGEDITPYAVQRARDQKTDVVFTCDIAPSDRQHLIDKQPVPGLTDNPVCGAASIEIPGLITLDLNITADEDGQPIPDFFVLLYEPTALNGWEEEGYLDDILSEGADTKPHVRWSDEDWKEDLRASMADKLFTLLAHYGYDERLPYQKDELSMMIDEFERID